MTFCHYQEGLSPHVMPFMRALVARLGEDEVRYVYMQDMGNGRRALGWNEDDKPRWTLDMRKQPLVAKEWLEKCPCLMSGCRDFDLFESRVCRSLPTFYSGERWFKPIGLFHGRFSLPGSLRLFSPRYFRMACRMRRLLFGKLPFYYLPTGIWAARDMVRLMSWFDGDIRPLRMVYQRMPGGCVQNRGKIIEEIRLTGYFVASSTGRPQKTVGLESVPLKILWVGRLLDWKCVDTIIRAVCAHVQRNHKAGTASKITLDVYGSGPEEKNLKRLAKGNEEFIRFYPPVTIDAVRSLMREHDVYVLASNAGEGWGAVTNEALEEGMHVLGTYEAGSSATILDEDALFHARDWKRLLVLLEKCLDQKNRGQLRGQGIGGWSVEKAVDRFVSLIKEVRKGNHG